MVSNIQYMYRKLPEYTKSLVIRQWLSGVQRDKIAGDSGWSAGAVTNVVNEWRRGLGEKVIDDLRLVIMGYLYTTFQSLQKQLRA
jgi:hypothetical protein